jgi:hypothetical protein
MALWICVRWDKSIGGLAKMAARVASSYLKEMLIWTGGRQPGNVASATQLALMPSILAKVFIGEKNDW